MQNGAKFPREIFLKTYSREFPNDNYKGSATSSQNYMHFDSQTA